MLIIIIFLMILVVLSGIVFCILKKDLLSPSQITIYVFILGAFFSLLGINEWDQVTVTFYSIMILFMGILSFVVGEFISIKVEKRPTVKGIQIRKLKVIEFPKLFRILNVVICLIAVIIYIRRMYSIAFEYGYVGGNDLMQRIRIGLDNESTGMLIVTFMNYCKSISVVYGYYMTKEINIYGIKYILKHRTDYIITIICALCICFFSTSRYNFIKYFSILFFSYILNYKLINHREIKLFTIVKWGGPIIISIFLIFIITGQSRLSFNESVSGIDKFVMYAGSSIPAFSYGLDHPGLNESTIFGGMTFTGLYSLFEYFGASSLGYVKFLQQIPLKYMLTTNVYTMQYNFICDFGISGMIILEVLIGLVYGVVYTKCLKSQSDTLNIFYTYYCYYLVMQLWNPQLFLDLFSITWIMEMFFISFVCLAIPKKVNYIQLKER